MKEIIVTGSSGFVGKNLCPYLESIGFKITKISLKNPLWISQISPNAYAIIHLAGLAHDLKNVKNADDYLNINTELTKEMFNFFKKSAIEKFIYFSSAKSVADSLGEVVLYEDFVPNPKTFYGISKLKAEEYILNNFSENQGKNIYILRPPMIHGPENQGNLNLLYKFVLLGIPYPLGAFDNKRSFLSIDNLNFIIAQLCLKNIESGIYNVADSEFISTFDLIKIINEGIGKTPRFFQLNKKTVTIAAKIGDKIGLPFNSEILIKLTENYMVSNSKIINSINQKLPVSAKNGLLKTIKSFNK